MIKTIQDIPEHIFKTSYQNATIGHVLTPPKLALEIIETLPTDFIKSGIKILEPACKNGSFLFQLVIKQLDNDWTIKEIEGSLYTCDTLNASLNVAESGIKHIFRFPYQKSLYRINELFYKHQDIEKFYDELIKTITKNKYIKIRVFINNLLLDKKNHWLIVSFEKNLIEFIKKYEGLSKTESKLFGEVFTPQELIEEMLDTLPKEFWNNKYSKILDPAVGIGNFPAAILKRFMNGLEEIIPEEYERKKWILEEMLYMVDISTKNLFLLYQLFDANQEFKLNVFRGDFLSKEFDKHMKEVWKLDGFDLVVGNPPYQEMDGGAKASASPIYNKFIEKGLDITTKMLFITPSRWFAGGKGLDKFRKMMMDRKDIKIIRHFDDATSIFGKFIEIKGGVSYFFIDKNYNGKTNFNGNLIDLNEFDILINKTEAFSFISKLINYESIIKIANPRSFFNVSTNDNRLKSQKIDEFHIKCFVSKHQGFEKWIDINLIKNKDKLNYYRVTTPRAATKGGEGFGNLFIIKPNECFSDSYMAFYINSEVEAMSLLSYLKTKFCNYILSLRKISQTVKISTCKWIPVVPFDREWTDEELYKYFDLTPEEIKLIEDMVK